tara:strand:+ start:543 stop:1094 length:552 start_codon:yes stop_codon:yes gene_type:complete
MFKFFIILIILNIYTSVFSSVKHKIISKMKLTNNLSFNFIQTIGDKSENGNCIIKYPKKIYCEYNNSKKKIIVSNGKSLVIKNRNSGIYYMYPLKKTPLELLLNKDYLISKINILEPKILYNEFLNFKILQNKNEINIFFNKKNFNLMGWQTEDIYQNQTITLISSVKINQKIDDKVFLLPKK